MTRFVNNTCIPGEPPWGRSREGLEENPRVAVPRQEPAYRCEKGCVFTVPLAADVTPPLDWDCRCGGAARLDGAPADVPAEPAFQKYTNGSGGHLRGQPREDITPMGQLKKRRSKKDGAKLLAERAAWVRENGVAR